MSWVTNTIVLRSAAWRRRNSFWRRSRLIGSIAPNGSSISISGGSAASARATPTRWRCPPESCAGYRPAISCGRPIRSSSSAHARRRAPLVPAEQPRDGRDVLADRAVREQADLLDHVADLAPQLDLVAVAHAAAADEDVAVGDVDHPVDHPHRGRLAAAGRPDEHADLAGRDLERQVVDGRPVGAGVALRRARGTPARRRHGRRTAPRSGRCWLWTKRSPRSDRERTILPSRAALGCSETCRAARRGVGRGLQRVVQRRQLGRGDSQRGGGQPVGEMGVLGKQRTVEIGPHHGVAAGRRGRPRSRSGRRCRGRAARGRAASLPAPAACGRRGSRTRPAPARRRARSPRCRSAAARPRAPSRGRRGRRPGSVSSPMS